MGAHILQTMFFLQAQGLDYTMSQYGHIMPQQRRTAKYQFQGRRAQCNSESGRNVSGGFQCIHHRICENLENNTGVSGASEISLSGTVLSVTVQ